MKILRKAISLFSVLICLTLLTGCWDAKELDDLSIPIVAGIDTILESEREYTDDKYLVNIEIPIFYEETKAKYHTVETTGRTPEDARGSINSKLGEQLISGQLQLLLFGEKLGKEKDLNEVTDVISRNPAIKASIFLVIVKGRAVDLMKKPVHDYPNIGTYLKTLLEETKNSNFYPYTTLFQFNRDSITYETATLMPHIIYKEGDIALAGSCLVNKGKVVGDLGRKETEIAVMLRGIKCHGTLNFDALQDGKVVDTATFEGRNSRRVKVERVDDKYVFNIQIKLEGIILEHEKQKPIQDGTDLLKLFQDSLEQHIKNRAEAFVEKTQEEFKFDTLCLANYIKAHTREKLAKEDIDKIVEESEINVEVKVLLRNAGGKM